MVWSQPCPHVHMRNITYMYVHIIGHPYLQQHCAGVHHDGPALAPVLDVLLGSRCSLGRAFAVGEGEHVQQVVVVDIAVTSS